ncbi:ATP-binding protein [Sorangium sp. So ce118]
MAGDAAARAASCAAPGGRRLQTRGPPAARAQDFFGRTAEQGETLDAIAKNLPAQILGGAKVGKSSLLRWVERHVPAGRPVAWIDPSVGFSPGMLVAAIARKVNRLEVAARIKQERATLRAAVEQLGRLGKLALILDEADKLATVGQGSDEDFFEVMRGHVEGRKITWVSASRRDLYEVFQ